MLASKDNTNSCVMDSRVARTNILVVDTDMNTLLSMKEMMGRYNYNVFIEVNAEKALLYLKDSKYAINLVVWDFHMPGINGIEALKLIGQKMDIPVVIMSDDNQIDDVREAAHHGVCDFVMKPVSQTVISVIWQHIVRKRIKSKQVLKQPDLAQSGRLTDRNGETSTKRTAWTRDTQPDNGDVNIGENAVQKPQTEGTQTEGSEQSSEETIKDRKGKKPRITRIAWNKHRHQSFLNAIDIIGGIEKANPMLILKHLEEMKIFGLSRDNVASHLQKYRLSLQQNKNPQRKEFRWSSFLQALNNVTTLPSYLLDDQSMNPIQQNQYPYGCLIMNNNQFVTNPLAPFVNGERLDEHQQHQYDHSANQQQQSRSANQQHQFQSPYPQQLYQSSSQQEQLLLSYQPQQYQSSKQQQQLLSSYPAEQYQSGNQQEHVLPQQYQSSNQQEQFMPQQYQSSNQHEHVLPQQYQSSNKQEQFVPQQYQSSYQSEHVQPQQYQSFYQHEQLLPTYQPEQYESSNQQEQLLPFYQPEQYQSSNQQEQLLSNQQEQILSSNQLEQLLASDQPHQYHPSDPQEKVLSSYQLQQYQSSDPQWQVLSSFQPQQYLSSNQQEQGQSFYQQQQYQSAYQEQVQSSYQQHQYQASSNLQEQVQPSNPQASGSSARDVNLIYLSS